MAWLRRMWNRQFDRYSCDDNYRWEIQLACISLRSIGVWPESEKTHRMRFLISLTIVVVFLTLPQDGQLFLTENESQLLPGIGSAIRHIHLIGSMFLLRFNSTSRQYILEEMQENWKTNSSKEDRKVMHRYAGFSRRIALIAIATTGFIQTVQCLNRLDLSEGKLTIIPGYLWYPFSLSNTYVLTICFITEVIAIHICMTISVGTSICLIVFILHNCGQIVILGNRIKTHDGKIRHSSGENIPRNCSCWKCIVDSHVRMCEFVKKIDNYFNIIIFTTLAWCVINFCCTGFEFLKAITTGDYGKLITYTFYTFATISKLVLYCWLAEMCQQRSNAIGDIAYSTQWMTIRPKISRNLIFIIRQTRIPLKITSAGYYVLSLSLFKEFLLTSLSYLSVLVSIKLSK